ncbi:MAG: hypothetical protein ABI402_07450, partial [Ferruginibacter sp.]
MKKLTVLFLLLLTLNKTGAQVGIGINPPDPSAMLHVQDTAKGLLVPRMTAAQRSAIQNPAEGLLVYQISPDKSFWYFTDGQWKNLTANNNGGKHTLYLADGITNAQAIAKIATDVGPNTQEVRIIRCTNLTSVDLSMITNLTEIYMSNNNVLQSVNFDNLQSVDAGIWIDQCPALTSLPLSHLQSIGVSIDATYGLHITYTGLPAINMNQVTRMEGSLTIEFNPALTTISFPLITLFQATPSLGLPFVIEGNGVLSNVSFPSLTRSAIILIESNYNFASVNFSALISADGFSIDYAKLMTSLSLPVLTKSGYMSIGSNDLLNTVSMPVLDSLNNGFSLTSNNVLPSISLPSLKSVYSLTITGNPLLTSFSVPLLNRQTYALTIQNNNALTALSFPSLLSAVDVSIKTNPALTSFSAPLMTSISSDISFTPIIISNNANLASINIDAVTTLYGYGFNAEGNKLASAQINYLLHKFATITP